MRISCDTRFEAAVTKAQCEAAGHKCWIIRQGGSYVLDVQINRRAAPSILTGDGWKLI